MESMYQDGDSNMQDKFFSLLISNYNNSIYFEVLYNSIIQQSYQNFEVIFVDDGSADGSVLKWESLTKGDKRFKIFVNQKNRGSAYTKRKCIDLASGNICGFLDADDLITENALEKMLEAHQVHPNASLVYSNLYIFKDKIDNASIYKYPPHIPKDKLLMVGLIPNHFATFKKSLYQKTSGINPNVMPAEDRDLVLKLEEVGDIVHIDDYLYYYRHSPESISNNENRYRAEYWSWQCRFDACERRGLDKEKVYIEVQKYRESVKNAMFNVKNTIDYKIGNALLSPFRKLKKLVYSINQIQ